MAQALVYDPRYHTFESWAALMCELYAAQQLEIPTQFTDWRTWGNGINAIDVFSNEAIHTQTNTTTGTTGPRPCSEQ